MDADQFGPPLSHELPWRAPLLLALATVAVVGLTGSAAYVYQKRMVTARTLDHLKAQSYAKNTFISSWFLDCESDMKHLAADPRLSPLASGRLQWAGLSEARRQDIKVALGEVVERHGFVAGALFDGQGDKIPGTEVGADPGFLLPSGPPYRPLSGTILSAAFRRDPSHPGSLEVTTPLGAVNGAAPRACAVFALNPWKTLFPGLTMPDSYLASAETLLLQREGGQITIANPTRCEVHAPLSIRMPFGPDGMSATAVRGGITQGQDRDYRGVAVLYATQYVPRAGWGIVVKADQRDVYATLRANAFLVWGLVLVSFLAIGNLGYGWWNKRHKALLGEFSALGLRYRSLVECAHEGIWVWDSEGRTLYANRRLAQMLGCTQEELPQRPVQDFLGPRDKDREPFLKAPGLPFQGEEHEVCLIKADGTDLWAILSLSSLFGPEGDSRGSLGLLTDLTARREVERERAELLIALNQKKADLQRLLQELIVTQEKERRHLSHELHDEIVQLLAGAGFYLQGVENNLPPAGLAPARAILDKAREQIGKAGARCRRLILELRPPDLERLGLIGALTNLLKESEVPRTQVIAADEKSLAALPWEDQLVIFRVSQEALQNVRKHAKATEVHLSIAATPAEILLRIWDDGQGFDLTAEAKPNHFGLIGMRERVELAGGALQLKSRPGAGTTVEVHLPFAHGEIRFTLLKGG